MVVGDRGGCCGDHGARGKEGSVWLAVTFLEVEINNKILGGCGEVSSTYSLW